MAADRELPGLIELLESSHDPVAQMRDWVVASHGYWASDQPEGLFEVQYLAIAGIGVGPAAAVRDWISKATLQFQVGTAA